MGDIRTPWTDPILPDHGLGGDSVVSSGSDPNAAPGEGAGGLKDFWAGEDQASTQTDIAETPNSISGLPLQPNRFAPSDNPPQPPSLEDRMPGTIDQR